MVTGQGTGLAGGLAGWLAAGPGAWLTWVLAAMARSRSKTVSPWPGVNLRGAGGRGGEEWSAGAGGRRCRWGDPAGAEVCTRAPDPAPAPSPYLACSSRSTLEKCSWRSIMEALR
jgi:hypothetical protein